MRSVLLLLLLTLPATARDLDLDGIVRKVGKRTSGRIVKLARELEGEELHAAAAACYRAVQEFDPDNAFKERAFLCEQQSTLFELVRTKFGIIGRRNGHVNSPGCGLLGQVSSVALLRFSQAKDPLMLSNSSTFTP